MARFIALLDASLLYSQRATNITLHAAKARLFQPTWSAAIHDEWTRGLIKYRPDASPEGVARRRAAMDRSFPGALAAGYEHLIKGIDLQDKDDRHVVAAAIKARADVIVTFNTKHFPNDELEKHGLEAQHPDTFLVHQLTLDPRAFLQCVRKARQQLVRPPYTAVEFLEGLRKANLPILAHELARDADSI